MGVQLWCRRWDISAQVPPLAAVGLEIAPAGAYLTQWVLALTAANQKAPPWGAFALEVVTNFDTICTYLLTFR